jgi:hypothetical protein
MPDPLKLKAFKRAFQKTLDSPENNYAIRKNKVQKAIDVLRTAVSQLTRMHNDRADEFLQELNDLRLRLETANDLARTNAKRAFQSLDAVKDRAREKAEEARLLAKKAPRRVELELGGEANVYAPDIPGYERLSEEDQEEMVRKVAKKIGSGKEIFQILESVTDGDFDNLPQPNLEMVSNLMWFVKAKAQEKIGEPYDRGALTIPDPGNKIRRWLDKCPEIYGRDSSHLKGEQRKTHGQARGIDFGGGITENRDVKDVNQLLPNGMGTLLVQQVKTSRGEDRIYLKVEPQSARWNPLFTKDDETPEPRALRPEDKDLGHILDFVKTKIGIAQTVEDRELKMFREAVDKAVKESYEKILSSAQKRVPLAVPVLKTGKRDIQQMLVNLDAVAELPIVVHQETAQRITEFGQLLVQRYGEGSVNGGARFGDEVVLDTQELLA